MKPPIHALHFCLVVLLTALLTESLPAGAAQETDGRTLERALGRALKLLSPPPTVPIRFVDPELVADPDAIRRVDAFTVREPDGRIRSVVYLNPRSDVVRQAMGGDDLYVAVLAAVIVHELEHLRGGTEAKAREVERELFGRLIATGRVPSESGGAYLNALAQQHKASWRH